MQFTCKIDEDKYSVFSLICAHHCNFPAFLRSVGTSKLILQSKAAITGLEN